MKKYAMFAYSIICYLIGFASILFWILSLNDLIPAISIDRPVELSMPLALLKNLGLVLLFAVPHSVMARKSFKDWITKHIPKPIERSTYVLQAGLLLGLLVWQWSPLGGTIWTVTPGTPLYYSIYVMFFLGWGILFLSTFLINHFDLFGLRQTFLELQNKPYKELNFKVISLYKYVRHPLYMGGIMGLWFTPVMSGTHLVFAISLTAYFFIGALFEERDLKKAFGEKYRAYANKTPMMIPLTKWKNSSNTSTSLTSDQLAEQGQ
ncbi:methyltransferase family protein [Reichenbachiella ulvae]|uniref:Isoprenylcysteine carboxylmethyltransferase family protein n=1 Tax=Reichenbachiella ulvae TaxID=2980104 RepID=A0ABT3CUE0_9BACT|nr:isoprenylcysteine carboxylmethyltransferase family protein [Reichenbachiella ulvae]MCV9387312.1 isoprenylcysteine carboxylmethyltransferase family protein [Reichenbachiella ulvae]